MNYISVYNKDTQHAAAAAADALDVTVLLVIPRRTSSFLVHRGAENKLAVLEQAHRLPVSSWKACHVLAWLEMDMKMTAYGQACYDNIKSGKVCQRLPVLQVNDLLEVSKSVNRI